MKSLAQFQHIDADIPTTHRTVASSTITALSVLFKLLLTSQQLFFANFYLQLQIRKLVHISSTMSKRASAGSNGGVAKDSVSPGRPLPSHSARRPATNGDATAMDKQKMLLSADVGHFSLVRAMHLADLITLMNGKLSRRTTRRATY